MKRKFGELELEILKVLKSGKKMTVREVLHVLGEENKYTTVMTVMNRLYEKNTLLREKRGLQYIYWIEASNELISSYITQFKSKSLSFKTSEIVSYLLEDAESISDDELLAMEEMIQKAREHKKKRD